VIDLITIYSTGCPRCRILLKKLEGMGITEYNLINDIEEMERLGITAVPMMKIDEEPLLNFSKAIEWINKQGE
jgi:hypothetical protein